MDISKPRSVVLAAEEALGKASFDPKRLVLLHGGITAAALMALALLNAALNMGIAGTGGLSGIGMRSMLESVASFLQMAANTLLPFWSMGYTAAILGFARGEQVNERTLLMGFRKLGPIARYLVTQFFLYLALGFACYYVSAVLFTATPWSADFMAMMEPYIMAGDPMAAVAGMDENAMFAMMEASVPLFIIFGILYFGVVLVLTFRLRFAGYAIMSGCPRAIPAFVISWQATKGACGRLLKLDLHFWWYYVLQVLVSCVAYADIVLALMGVETGLDGAVVSLVCYGVHLLANLALGYFALNRVETSFALWYDHRLQNPDPKPEPKAQKHPWEE